MSDVSLLAFVLDEAIATVYPGTRTSRFSFHFSAFLPIVTRFTHHSLHNKLANVLGPNFLGGNHMKRALALVLAAAAIGGALPGCAYGSIATAGDKVVITRQDGFLFGALRKVFVCKVTDGGAASCHDQDSP
jgi:hypothetical protein